MSDSQIKNIKQWLLQWPTRLLPRLSRITPQDICSDALAVLSRLRGAGYQAYVVGGGVRDRLLGLNPKDFDIATDARPEQIRALFSNCRLIGRRFRLAHIYFRRHVIEVATFRASHTGVEINHSGRVLDDNVYGSLEDDVWRRDFTINALYYCPATERIIDHVGGIRDLKHRRIRLIGSPERRYREDPVRMLRALRFQAKLGFHLESATQRAIAPCRDLLVGVPPARLQEEFNKLFMYGHAVASFKVLDQHRFLILLLPHRDQWDSAAERLAQLALLSTDERVGLGKPVTPAFLLAAFLWFPQQQLYKQMRKSMMRHDAWREASQTILSEQHQCLNFPKRFAHFVRECWDLQYRLQTQQRCRQLVRLPRFRAAYDFYCLRAQMGDASPAIAAWWTEFQQAPDQQQSSMLKQLAQPKSHR